MKRSSRTKPQQPTRRQTPRAAASQTAKVQQPSTAKMQLQSELRLPYLLEFTPVIIYTAKPRADYGALFVSENVIAQMGYIPSQFTDDSEFWVKHLHPDDAPRVLAALPILFQTDQHKIEYRFRYADGSYHWMLDEMQLIRDAANQPLEIIGYWLDITERKQAEEALRESEEQIRSLFENSKDAILLSAPDGSIYAANPAACQMFGRTEAEIRQIGRKGVIDTTDPHLTTALEERARTGTFMGELMFVRKDGTKFLGELSSEVFKDRNGQPRTSMLIRDITDRKQAEEALSQTNLELKARNEELDAFAHTVAHDLKNPVQLIIGNAEILTADWADLDEKDRQQTLASLAHSGHKLSTIIDELLLLAGLRQTEVERGPLDMLIIVNESLSRLTDIIRRTQAEISIQNAGTWPTALGYSGWIEEVWANYINNALSYGGRPPRVIIGADSPSAGEVRFWVRDNGHGLTAEEQSRLFIPFTRLEQARVKGHGLGLSIVRRIMEKLGGQVGVTSAIGEGSTFYFTLPAADH
ncbi:MAG TPA: PAS domain S-box protein [Anaerolineae bacterium]|nr:PAS domain S-box protein [Anaerolineae bacterium]